MSETIYRSFRQRDAFSPGHPEVTLTLEIDVAPLVRQMSNAAFGNKNRIATKAGGAIRLQAGRADPAQGKAADLDDRQIGELA